MSIEKYVLSFLFNIYFINFRGISWLIIYISIWGKKRKQRFVGLFLWLLLLGVVYAAALSHLFYIHCDRKFCEWNSFSWHFLSFSSFFMVGEMVYEQKIYYYMYANAFCLTYYIFFLHLNNFPIKRKIKLYLVGSFLGCWEEK